MGEPARIGLGWNEEMDAERKTPPRPRRVIHWDPAQAGRGIPAGGGEGQGPGVRPGGGWRQRLRWVGVLFGVAFLLWLGWRIWLVVIVPELARQEVGDPAIAAAGAVEADGFLSAARVARVRAEAEAAVVAVRKLPAEHPALERSLMDLDRALGEGERRWAGQRLEAAWQQYRHVMALASAHRSLADARAEAARLQDQFLDLLPMAEAARRHDPQAYERTLAAAAVARAADEGGRFHESATGFARAVEAAAGLVATAEQWLDQQLLAGQRALGEGNGVAAREAFEAVLAVRPDHAAARRGRARAAGAAEVARLVGEGAAALDSGDPAGAVAALRRARELDTHSVAAQQGLSRAEAAVRQRAYESLVARAEEAQARADWDGAISAWEQAGREHPERSEVAGRLAQTRELAFRARVRAATVRGLEAEAQRDWQAARSAYSEALALDAAHESALQGMLRTGEVLRALVRYDRLLAEASALALRGEFVAAIAAFNQAMGSKPDYLPLSEDSLDLKRELERQGVPVPVRFVSDGQTHVTISGFSLLGQFREREESILPGNYVIRGRKRGHREVVIPLRVRAGEPVPPVTVVATERITSR